MSAFFSILSRIFGRGSDEGETGTAPAAEAVEYKGYLIIPAPYSNKGQFQTAGIIRKELPAGTKEQRFVRAETHASLADAVSFATAKGRQIIDEQGDRLFE